MARQRTPPRKVIWMQVKDPTELTRARRFEGYTQRDLAALCKCSQTTVYLLEKGKMRTLSDDLAVRLAKRLRRPVESLFMPRMTTVGTVAGTAA